jgi:hypothetical protein
MVNGPRAEEEEEELLSEELLLLGAWERILRKTRSGSGGHALFMGVFFSADRGLVAVFLFF